MGVLIDQALDLLQDLVREIRKVLHHGLHQLEELSLDPEGLERDDPHKLADGLQRPLQQEEIHGVPRPDGFQDKQNVLTEIWVVGFLKK